MSLGPEVPAEQPALSNEAKEKLSRVEARLTNEAATEMTGFASTALSDLKKAVSTNNSEELLRQLNVFDGSNDITRLTETLRRELSALKREIEAVNTPVSPT